MNSKHRAPKGLGKTLNLSDSLKDLPLQTAITELHFHHFRENLFHR